MGLLDKVGAAAARVRFAARANAPEILLGAGVVCIVAGGAAMFVKSRKVHELLDEQGRRELEIADTVEDEREAGREILRSRVGCAIGTARELALPIALLGGSVACFVVSHNVQARRLAMVTMAYNSAVLALDEYRERVRAQFGEEVDEGYARGGVIESYDEDAKKFHMTNDEEALAALGLKADVVDRNYWTFCWCRDTSNGWEKDKLRNLNKLEAAEKMANHMLRARGYLFVDEVFDLLEMNEEFKRSFPEARVMGWRVSDEQVRNAERNGEPVEYVRFGINDPANEYFTDWHFDHIDGHNAAWLTLKGMNGFILTSPERRRPTESASGTRTSTT